MRFGRIHLDAVMLLLLMTLFCDRWTGNAAHETAGVLMAGCAALHLVWNRTWFAGLWRGSRSALRPVRLLSDLSVLGLFTATALTGIAMSKTVFAFMGFAESLALRAWHMGLSHWFLLAAGVHLGLHAAGLAASLPAWAKTRPARAAGIAALAVLLGFGLHGLLTRDMAHVLTMRSAFSFWAENDAPWRMAAEYAGMAALAAAPAAWLAGRRRARPAPDGACGRAAAGRGSGGGTDGASGRAADRRS